MSSCRKYTRNVGLLSRYKYTMRVQLPIRLVVRKICTKINNIAEILFDGSNELFIIL